MVHLISENPLAYEVNGQKAEVKSFECTEHSKAHSIKYVMDKEQIIVVYGVGDFENCEECSKFLA